MSLLDEIYEQRRLLPSDINEHLPVLKRYSTGKRVLELGVRDGNSTAALLAGRPKYMLSVDLGWLGYDSRLPEAAAQEGIVWEQRNCDSAIPQGEFDVTFIDTRHTEAHVRDELAAHAPNTREFLIFHDTAPEANWNRGEYGGPGIGIPIQELLDCGEWERHEELVNNNGLLVLRRVGDR